MPVSKKELFAHIRKIQIRTTREVNSLFAGAYRSAFKGVGLEFEDVREYQPGDDVNHIDWHLTARMQRPYIKNFKEERELTVMLAVDISASTRFGSKENLKSDLIAELGALLAFSAIKNHDKVGLLLFTDEVELYLKPKKNLRHVLRVIRELLFYKPKQSGTNLEKALKFFGQLQKRRTICFVISDFVGTTPVQHQINLLSKQHELIFIEIYDPMEQVFPDLGLAYIQDLETKELELVDTAYPSTQSLFKEESQIQRSRLKEVIYKAGATLLPIRTDESYRNALRKFFKLRRKQH